MFNFFRKILNTKASQVAKAPAPNLGFWRDLRVETCAAQRTIVVLAPMADVTDAAFRRVIAKHGKPDVTWTEFVSADGLMRATEEGKRKLMKDLIYSESERPIVAQLFGSRPEYMRDACKLCAELGFDGIDLNMGCPDKSIEKQGAGAGMIKNPARAKEIVLAAMEGVALGLSAADKAAGKMPIPVTVKTRIGYNKNELETWLPKLLEAAPAVVTVHARTRKEMSKVPARWEHLREAVEIRDRLQAHLAPEDRTLILGNGDIISTADANIKVQENGADGAMLGRAIFGNPWLFSTKDNPTAPAYVPTVRERLEAAIEHTKLFDELLGDTKNFAIMKKHFKAYINGFDEAKELRMKLMETENAAQVETLIGDFLKGMK